MKAKQRASVTEYLHWLLRYARAWLRWKTRRLSAEERAERKQRRADVARKRGLKKRLLQESQEYARVIRQRLTCMGHCYRYRKNESDMHFSGIQEVRFDRVAVSEEAIWLRIDSRRVPRGVQIRQIISEEILEELSLSCRRKVQAKRETELGAWFIIDRGIGARGIPRHVTYSDMLAHYPKTAGPLVVPAGKGENQRYRWIDLDSSLTPHLLVGGATGQGKSVFINNVVCSLIQRNSPARLKLLMIDLKIVELTFYKKIPHLLETEQRTIETKDGTREVPAIVTDRIDVIPLLQIVYNEMQRRLQLFEGKARDIGEWNHKHRKDPLPFWVLVVDEVANIMLDKGKGGLARPAERLLADIAARGRAPGVHLIVATQRPDTDVVTGLIKANFPARAAFACASQVDSRVIIDISDAWGLEPLGRMILARGADQEEIQVPFVSTEMVESIVRDVIGGKVGIGEVRMRHDVTEEEMLRYAITALGGSFAWRKMYDHFGPKGVTTNEIKALGQRLDGQIVEVDGRQFKVEPSKGGSDSRRLIPMGYGIWDSDLGDRLHPDNEPLPAPEPESQALETPAGVTPESQDTGVPLESHVDVVGVPGGEPQIEPPGGNGKSPKRKRQQREEMGPS